MKHLIIEHRHRGDILCIFNLKKVKKVSFISFSGELVLSF